MKKLLALVAVVGFFAVFYSSCAKDKAQKPQPLSCTGINPDSNTYTLNVKAILDYNCAYGGCHDHASAPTSSNVDLEGYSATKATFQGRNVFCSLNHGTGCLPMPQSLPKLADSLITYLQCWADNGYPQ